MSEAGRNGVWTDEAGLGNEALGRESFVSVVCTRIDALQVGQSSTVFGLIGPWGSGKTTLLGQIVENLTDWTTVWFAPWSAVDGDEVATEFVAALTEAFPASESILNKLAKYAKFGTPALKLIPYVGGAVSDVADATLETMSRRPSWHTSFEALSDAISQEGHRVLVIVDDVDRLDVDELRALLRVVRLLGRFKNVHYLMAYDQATVEDLLASSGPRGHSSNFMEKIVQYPFEVPAPAREARLRWARKVFAGLAGFSTQSRALEGAGALVDVLSRVLDTPRAAQRLTEQVRSLATLVEGAEIDPFDFVAITWLRLAHHALWEDIRANEEIYSAWQTEDDSEPGELERRVRSLVTRGDPHMVWRMVSFLFEPRVDSWRATARNGIRNSRYFDRYFLLGLPEGDISDLEVCRLVDRVVAGEVNFSDGERWRGMYMNPDRDLAWVAFDVSREYRSESQVSSKLLVKFLAQVRLEYEQDLQRNDLLWSPIEHWLVRELWMVLDSGSMTVGETVSMFDYSFLLAGFFALRREYRDRDGDLKILFGEVGRIWLNEVMGESLEKSLSRNELIRMQTFLKLVAQTGNVPPVLSARIGTLADYLSAADAFVDFDEWMGSRRSYEVTFRQSEFVQAVGTEKIREFRKCLPIEEANAGINLDHLAEPDIPEDQRRSFVLQALRALP